MTGSHVRVENKLHTVIRVPRLSRRDGQNYVMNAIYETFASTFQRENCWLPYFMFQPGWLEIYHPSYINSISKIFSWGLACKVSTVRHANFV